MRPHPRIVAAFTHANDDLWLPPEFVVGELKVHHVVALDYDQYLVDGIGVAETTITPLPNTTRELVRVLREKRSKWARHDRLLAERRAREDDSFREASEDEESDVHLVREDRLGAFGAFCDEMRNENQRLTAERRAEVAALVREHQRKAP